MDTKVYTDAEMLKDLNKGYLAAVVSGDVEAFERILSDDFLCSAPDGALLTKAEFLPSRSRRTSASRSGMCKSTAITWSRGSRRECRTLHSRRRMKSPFESRRTSVAEASSASSCSSRATMFGFPK